MKKNEFCYIRSQRNKKRNKKQELYHSLRSLVSNPLVVFLEHTQDMQHAVDWVNAVIRHEAPATEVPQFFVSKLDRCDHMLRIFRVDVTAFETELNNGNLNDGDTAILVRRVSPWSWALSAAAQAQLKTIQGRTLQAVLRAAAEEEHQQAVARHNQNVINVDDLLARLAI